MRKVRLSRRWVGSFVGLMSLLIPVRLICADVEGKVAAPAAGSKTDESGVVVSLSPADQALAGEARRAPIRAVLTQKNKTFSPHILVIPPGSTVEFPNRDPFFHNVFSLFEGKRFDLGLYESGSTRSVKFDRPGVSYIFCNIHPRMSAIVIALDTPYYSVADTAGDIKIRGVPPGQYLVQVWAEGLDAEQMQKLYRRIAVDQDVIDLGTIEIPLLENLATHKNKYGRDYDPAAPNADYEPH